MDDKDREILLNAIIGLMDKAIKNNTKELQAKIKQLEMKLDWYKEEFGKWEDGDEIESICRGRKIDYEQNQKLREAIGEIRKISESYKPEDYNKAIEEIYFISKESQES
jgi:hypothetical protein